MSKRKKIIIGSIIIVFILINVVGLFIGNFFYNLAINPHSDKSIVLEADHNKINWDESKEKEYEEIKQKQEDWLNKQDSSTMSITSRDKLKLSATLVKQNSNKYVIICHGYGGYAMQMLASGITFFEKGFNVLLPDARGLGESEGNYIGMGWDERLDIVDWINEIVKQDKDAEIILYGVSMGGATVMMTSGEDLPSNVKAIIEDCGYTSIWDEFNYQLKQIFNLPSFPIMNYASLVTKIRAGYWLEDGSAINQVKKSKTPMLFIHGTEDTFVPSYMVDEVYNAATCEKEKLIVPGAGHGAAASVLGDAYWIKVDSFIAKYLNK